LISYLQGNTALVIGLLLLVVVLLTRAFARDTQLKIDLRGAMLFFLTWLVLRGVGYVADQVNLEAAQKAARVVWMLAFAYGCVRTFVAYALWVYRRFAVGTTHKILRDVIDFSLYVIATIPILKTQLQIDLTSLLATSAILSVVLGLALQETLGNLFAGLALQLERPFRAGDYISVGDHVGKVVQVAWRTTRIETFRLEAVTVPNSNIAKQPLRNYSRGGGVPVGVDLTLSLGYGAAPNTVRAEVASALAEIPLVLKQPAHSCWVVSFGDNGVVYLLRFFCSDFEVTAAAQDEVLTRLWYRFARAGIEIPFPQHVVHMRNEAADAGLLHQGLLAQLDLFAPFSREELADLARSAVERRFGRGEALIREGDEGHTFYVIVSGEVAVARGGTEVVRLNRGAYLGEMSLLTGEPRSATVVATSDLIVLELDREAFARHFAQKPERAQQMSDLLAQRRSQLDQVATAAGAARPMVQARDIFQRLKQIFRLKD
jgi:small-conductance mechanosensitive channel/CRP-like cAMP-binding protein